MIIRKTFTQEATPPIGGQALDDGQWLRPFMAAATEKTRSQPDAGAVARIREAVLNRIDRESIRLVA